jgi:hypothetical protein
MRERNVLRCVLAGARAGACWCRDVTGTSTGGGPLFFFLFFWLRKIGSCRLVTTECGQ